MDVRANLHPAFGGKTHTVTVEVTTRAGRSAIVATCSCLGWSASALVRPALERAQTAEIREAWGDHAAAAIPVPRPEWLTP